MELTPGASVAAPLQKFNLETGPATAFAAVVLHVLDDQNNVQGGLFGRIGYDWLHIEFLVVPEDGRGQGIGTALMQQAEAIALDHNCIGVYLDTLEFQARAFYEKLGYTLFGTLQDFPRGGNHYFLRKNIET